MPKLLAETYLQATQAVQEAARTKYVPFQATHLSRYLLHLVINLRDVIQKGTKAPDPNKLDRCIELDE
jgi:hypothetical protein